MAKSKKKINTQKPNIAQKEKENSVRNKNSACSTPSNSLGISRDHGRNHCRC